MILRRVKRSIQFLAMIFYTLFCLFTLPNCANESNQSTSQKLISLKKTAIYDLEDKYDAEYYSSASKIKVGSIVVLDTTVISVKKWQLGYIVKVTVNCDDGKSVFAELKCTKQIADKFMDTRTNNLLIVGEVKNIQQTSVISEADSLSGKSVALNSGQTYLIQGNCFDILEY